MVLCQLLVPVGFYQVLSRPLVPPTFPCYINILNRFFFKNFQFTHGSHVKRFGLPLVSMVTQLVKDGQCKIKETVKECSIPRTILPIPYQGKSYKCNTFKQGWGKWASWVTFSVAQNATTASEVKVLALACRSSSLNCYWI